MTMERHDRPVRRSRGPARLRATQNQERSQHAGPGYWIYETSGKLRLVIERYLDNTELSPQDCATMRAYLRQWIFSPVWDGNPHGRDILADLRNRVDSLTDRGRIDHWLRDAEEFGVDPL